MLIPPLPPDLQPLIRAEKLRRGATAKSLGEPADAFEPVRWDGPISRRMPR